MFSLGCGGGGGGGGGGKFCNQQFSIVFVCVYSSKSKQWP